MPRRRTDPRLAALKAVPLFSGLRRSDLAAVAQLADEVEVPAGKELIAEGAPGSQFFVLLEGEADVRRRGRRINRLEPGDFFGEIALLSNRPTTASVRAATPLRVLVLSRRSFAGLLRDSPAIQWDLIQALVKRVPDDERLPTRPA